MDALSVFRYFLRVARGTFDDGADLRTSLRAMGPQLRTFADEIAAQMTNEERVFLGPTLDMSSQPKEADAAKAAEQIIGDPAFRQRALQKCFVARCGAMLAELDGGVHDAVLEGARLIAARIPTDEGVASLANEAGLGWLASHPAFVEVLFHAEGLAPCDARALLHHVPKTGGTSLNLTIERDVPSAKLIYPCISFADMVKLGGALYGIDLLNDLAETPRQALVLAGHYNLSRAIGRSSGKGKRCVSLLGDPDRLLSSGLRYHMTLATTSPAIARWIGMSDADVDRIRSLARNGGHGGNADARDFVDRVLSSPAFGAQFRDPIARWYLPIDGSGYDARLSRFEREIASLDSFVIYESPSPRCIEDLGLKAEREVILGRENVSAISASRLNALVGGIDWLHARFRDHDLIGVSDAFYGHLKRHHEVRAGDS